MKTITIFIIIFQLSFIVFSQKQTFKIEDSGITPSYKVAGNGNINITQDAKILQIVKRHKELNNNKFPGWRVQIYFGSGQKAMAEAQSAKKHFLIRYGNNLGAYIVYDSPFYKVRVGDFRTKAEALNFKDKIKSTFHESWIVTDRINYPFE
ncbi:MAG: SPOR domain-containing protein [Bacteroidales bacterium]|nr:SPOR domain-containing protein [Bacteroidales bacterium]